MYSGPYSNEKERSVDIMRLICRFKIEYPESLKAWYSYEEILMEAVRRASLSETRRLNDQIAQELFQFLVIQSESYNHEHINRTIGTD